LDDIKPIERNENAPLRIPVTDRYKEMGALFVHGKVESGSVTKGQNVLLMPNRNNLKVTMVFADDKQVKKVAPGENVRLAVTGCEEADIATGFVICDTSHPTSVVTEFTAQLVIIELMPSSPLFTAGYEAVLHVHTCFRDITVVDLESEIDKKTRKPSKKKPKFVKTGAVVIARIAVNPPVCIEVFDKFPQLGRFTLRDKGKTIAIGKVISINTTV